MNVVVTAVFRHCCGFFVIFSLSLSLSLCLLLCLCVYTGSFRTCSSAGPGLVCTGACADSLGSGFFVVCLLVLHFKCCPTGFWILHRIGWCLLMHMIVWVWIIIFVEWMCYVCCWVGRFCMGLWTSWRTFPSFCQTMSWQLNKLWPCACARSPRSYDCRWGLRIPLDSLLSSFDSYQWCLLVALCFVQAHAGWQCTKIRTGTHEKNHGDVLAKFRPDVVGCC